MVIGRDATIISGSPGIQAIIDSRPSLSIVLSMGIQPVHDVSSIDCVDIGRMELNMSLSSMASHSACRCVLDAFDNRVSVSCASNVFLDTLLGALIELLNSSHFRLGANTTQARSLHHHQVMYL
ncbi:uncharacterized protein AKAW2_50889A [Aspergillus luchuensis]|uniref:Uncharacterized protein n=1 Tax=Aspergillus kawachii TaxID=1069201 RepID=A0A7R8A181_ASPKA|nr:uncharacterized protein AKAW2_50889A [Aspergillus luchuensis]BCS00548.1 hypothetical protein AKAW2_50889A [Aspergillus luchuensis]